MRTLVTLMIKRISLNDLGPSERFELLWQYVDKRIPIFLIGPAGSGKSYIGLKLMKRFVENFLDNDKIFWLRDIDETAINSLNGVKALYVSGSANVTKLDLLGGRILLGGEYVRKPGLLNCMVRDGGVIFLDEVTSLPPQFTILLNEIIDVLIRGDAHENFYIFFAGNPSTYLGANELPDSLLERIVSIWFDYYPFNYEFDIVYNMVRQKFANDPIVYEEGFKLLIQFIIGVLRNIREELNNAGEICPISVRTVSYTHLTLPTTERV